MIEKIVNRKIIKSSNSYCLSMINGVTTGTIITELGKIYNYGDKEVLIWETGIIK